MQSHSHPRLYALEQVQSSKARRKQIARDRRRLLLMVVLACLAWLAFGCAEQAYGPKHNPKPRPMGIIRDREEPRPRYSVARWGEDTTSHH